MCILVWVPLFFAGDLPLLLYNVKHLHAATPKCMPHFVHQLPHPVESTSPPWSSCPPRPLFATFCICIYVRRQFELPRLRPAPAYPWLPRQTNANRSENISHFHETELNTWPPKQPTHLPNPKPQLRFLSLFLCERVLEFGLEKCSQFASPSPSPPNWQPKKMESPFPLGVLSGNLAAICEEMPNFP